jgi:hypothetical protein
MHWNSAVIRIVILHGTATKIVIILFQWRGNSTKKMLFCCSNGEVEHGFCSVDRVNINLEVPYILEEILTFWWVQNYTGSVSGIDFRKRYARDIFCSFIQINKFCRIYCDILWGLLFQDQ